MIIELNIFDPIQYELNPFFIPPFLIACLVLFFGFFVLSLERRSPFNRSFLYLCISTSVWLGGQSLILSGKYQNIIFFWSRIMYVGLIFIAATLLHLSVAYTDRLQKEKQTIALNYVFACGLSLILWKPGIFTGLRHYQWGAYPDAGGPAPYFLIFLLFCPILGLANLISYYRKASTILVRKRTKHLMIGFIFVSLSNVDIVPSYGLAIYPFGYIAVLCFILSIIYSIIKYHNLMVQSYSLELREEVDKKTRQLSGAVEQLKATQVKLFETGKISAMASLSAGILHQISQPITAIHGFVKFMRKEMKENDPFFKPVILMDEQSQYLKSMLEDLMELIRHRKIKKDYVNVNQSLKKAVDLLTDEIRIRRVELQVNMAESLPTVYADAIHLQQIFMNIMVNAIQALSNLEKGALRRLLVVTRYEETAQEVVIAFRDSGPGLSQDDKNNVFEPFFSTKTKGSGIGLALCKDLIAEHGGTIDVVSDGWQGATFVIKIPKATP